MKILQETELKNILFIDIETAPLSPDYKSLTPEMKKHWDNKAAFLSRKQGSIPEPERQFEKAAIYAEFSRVICISTGIVTDHTIRVRSFTDNQENELLAGFAGLCNQYYYNGKHRLCAHNGKEFDFPFLARRMLVNEIPLPSVLDIAGKKPWEVNHIDTMELWKFGDYKNFTSLDLLCSLFKIPGPKNDISGSDVSRVYWIENDLERIVRYCQKDVIALIQLLLKLQGLPLIEEDCIFITSDEQPMTHSANHVLGEPI